MKIFVSYSRRDAGDFANQIQRHLSSFKHEIFTDVDSIRAGEIWSNTIETNISNCDIFVVIVTHGSLNSRHVEREVLQAQKDNKKIIPCFHKNVSEEDIKWELNKIQGIEFTNEYQLARDLFSKIAIETKTWKDTKGSIGSLSKIMKDATTDVITPTKSDVDKLEQMKEDPQSVSIERIEALGSKLPVNTQQSISKRLTASKAIKYVFEKAWSTEFTPSYIAVDPGGYVYLSLSDYKTFTSRRFLRDIKKIEFHTYIYKYDSNGAFINTWNLFFIPKTDFFNHLSSFSLITSILERSSGIDSNDYQSRISGLAIDSLGNVYVSGEGNTNIQKFDNNGTLITKWWYKGNRDGEFKSPNGIAVDSSSGNVYVVDALYSLIYKFDSNGNFIIKWGSSGSDKGKFKNPQFDSPSGIAVDSSSGNVYVVDSGNNCIHKFDNNGNFITKWGSKGELGGQFSYPKGIAIDSSGYVYVVDNYNHRIQKFDSNGNFITKWGNEGNRDGEFKTPNGIAVDSSSGNVYVVDSGNNRIQIFAPVNDL